MNLVEHLPLAVTALFIFGSPIGFMIYGVRSGDFAKWRRELRGN